MNEDDMSKEALSRYMRTTRLFRSSAILSLPDDVQIRLFAQDESEELKGLTRKRNVWVRNSWENHFYLKRIESIANSTIIEVFRPGDPDDMMAEAAWSADWAEKVAFLSSSLAFQRKAQYKLIGIGGARSTAYDLTIGPGFYSLRSKSRKPTQSEGIPVDARFVNRFNKCGFSSLYAMCVGNGGMSDRMRLVVGWLFESRQECHLPAALVKTAIALESLLIFSESESLARTLSERAAFLLSPNPQIREIISKTVKRFYDTRSGVVHGSSKKAKTLTSPLVEGMDRLVLLLCLTIAANSTLWNSKEALQMWCEKERWGSPSSDAVVPYPAKQLSNALSFSGQDASTE
jgi:hypothetical protein